MIILYLAILFLSGAVVVLFFCKINNPPETQMRKMDKWYWVGTSPYIFERILLDYCLRVYQNKGKWGWEVRKVNWTEEMNKRMKNPDLPSFSLEFPPGITVISGNASTVIRAAEMAELAARVKYGKEIFDRFI
jgi:hypothetical protein